jgi:hypothetical protein
MKGNINGLIEVLSWHLSERTEEYQEKSDQAAASAKIRIGDLSNYCCTKQLGLL